MTYYAHLAEDGRTQTVVDHLQNTGTLCAEYASSFGAEEQGFFIGYTHDIGKCSDAFQSRLKGGHVVDHSSAGALECAKMEAFWAACCVSGHHGGLPDFGNIKIDQPGDATLFGRLKNALSGNIPTYKVPVTLNTVASPNGYGKDTLTDSFIIRMLYSCLVDADYQDTENFMTKGFRTEHKKNSLSELLSKLNQYVKPWWKPSNALNQKRCEILHTCIEKGKEEKGVYTLTIPTGGGKTISSIAFALNHAVKHGMERVIYVIPYTSIIEQTADIFRTVFGAENIVEHHSNAAFEVLENGDISHYGSLESTENWDAPIIVTTAVQFFDSLYASRPAKCRKLHRIANSVLIFDEVQMLPAEHLRPCVAAIAKMVSVFESTAVLCTATQPTLNGLFKEFACNLNVREIYPKTTELYSQFRRTVFENIGTISIDYLTDRLSEAKQVLCIVNSRRAARMIFEQLPLEGSYHLSTLMYPKHRREVLAEIHERLNAGMSCRVVSTSLIEAGVDVDFPTVFREMAGLDSILQAAGRCNREGKNPSDKSVVTIFDGISETPQILKINIGAAREVLRSGADPAAPETISHYFQTFHSLAGTRMDKYDVIASFEEGIQGRKLPFRSVAERFHLISDDTRTVYIPLGHGADLVQRLHAGEHSRSLIREIGQYGVNVYENDFISLLNSGALETVDTDSGVLIDLDLYDQKTGLLSGNHSNSGLFI